MKAGATNVRDNAILPPTASSDDAGARFVSTDAGPTASGDCAGERFCAPLPPSPHFSGSCPDKTGRVSKNLSIFTLFYGGDPQVEGTRKSRWSRVGTWKIIS